MSTYTLLQNLRQRHAGAATCQPGTCDACKLMELVEQARDALMDLQERNSKGQYDQTSFAEVIRSGLGTMSGRPAPASEPPAAA